MAGFNKHVNIFEPLAIYKLPVNSESGVEQNLKIPNFNKIDPFIR